jgi:hypothetical protein
MEWDSDAIRTWFFPRGSALPHSLTSESPDTSEFGTPAANFKGDCNIDERFRDQRFIFTNNCMYYLNRQRSCANRDSLWRLGWKRLLELELPQAVRRCHPRTSQRYGFL